MPGRTLSDMVKPSRQAKPGPHRTLLSLLEELEFGGWVKSQKIPYEDTPDADYDMRGYWKALRSGDQRAQRSYNPLDGTRHFPDIWKTPYHQSFSNESMYALPTAPRWDGDRLVNALGGVLVDESKRRK